jgi:hypothetical protein
MDAPTRQHSGPMPAVSASHPLNPQSASVRGRPEARAFPTTHPTAPPGLPFYRRTR